MKLSKWAEKQGVCYRTAYQWFRDGRIPNAEQKDTGTIIIHEEADYERPPLVCVYARVSTYQRKDCLKGQVDRCVRYANAQGIIIDKVYKEIASGMNDKRPKLLKMLESKPSCILVEHKDKLTRFGFNYLEVLLKQLGCTIIVLNRDEEDEKDLIKDLVSIITSFCCRLYGLRRGYNKAKHITQEIESSG